MTLTDQIREAIRRSGSTRYEISAATGISQGQLANFLAGKRRLRSDTLDRLAEYLGLRIVPSRRRR